MDRLITIGSGVVAFAVTAVSTSCFLLHRTANEHWVPEPNPVTRQLFAARHA
ncbi:hypothetical protein FHU29_003629 [Hoyosella altamirensis]|uniref:Lipoprotein n=1 Tax=Hoyosella altamirensis TaxID=616997 RepID=A0A839RRJ7_9ACTN|nr:hypothetical protein [Hoyosella altamirensis]